LAEARSDTAQIGSHVFEAELKVTEQSGLSMTDG